MKPTPFSIARAGARSTPSVSSELRRLAGSVGVEYDAHAASVPRLATLQREDARVREPALELGGDRGAVRLPRPDDDGRARARERDAGRARGRLAAELVEERRVRGAVRLVQAVVEGARRGASRRRPRSRRRAARPARRRPRPRRAAASRAAASATRRCSRASSGTTAIGASGRSVAIRAACGPAPFRQIRQTPPRSAAARLSACPSSGRPSSSSSSGASVAARRRRRRRRARRRSSPRSTRARARAGSGSRSGSGDRSSGASERERAEREVLRVVRHLGRALALDRDDAGSPSTASSTCSSFQSSSAAAAQSNPGPRFAVVAGARTTMRAHVPAPSRCPRRTCPVPGTVTELRQALHRLTGTPPRGSPRRSARRASRPASAPRPRPCPSGRGR